MAYQAQIHDDPATHVLVIGVGNYTHLPDEGGGGPPAQGSAYASGLTKISTSVPSATRVANWFLDSFQNTERPLGSIDILLSGEAFLRKGKPAPDKVPTPTFLNIRTAFREWRERCHANELNHAVFYFCGHGMEASSHYLLAEDVFADEGAIPENFIDLDATLTRMKECQATTQLYFIDACRTTFSHKLESIHAKESPQGRFGRPLLTSGVALDFNDRNAFIYKSSKKRGLPALARTQQESYFVEALIECLDHFGAGNDFGTGQFTVRMESLKEALNERLQRMAVKYAQPALGLGLQTDPGLPLHDPNLHFIAPADALVQSSVQITPPPAHAVAEIRLQGPQSHSRSPSEAPWLLEIPPGDYDVTVDFPGTPYAPLTFRRNVTMPRYPISGQAV